MVFKSLLYYFSREREGCFSAVSDSFLVFFFVLLVFLFEGLCLPLVVWERLGYFFCDSPCVFLISYNYWYMNWFQILKPMYMIVPSYVQGQL